MTIKLFSCVIPYLFPVLLFYSGYTNGSTEEFMEAEELWQIMKEELDSFQVDMTKSFMEAHRRHKRGNVLNSNIRYYLFIQFC